MCFGETFDVMKTTEEECDVAVVDLRWEDAPENIDKEVAGVDLIHTGVRARPQTKFFASTVHETSKDRFLDLGNTGINIPYISRTDWDLGLQRLAQALRDAAAL